MRRSKVALAALAALVTLAACSSAPQVPGSVGQLMIEAPEDQPTRLLLSGDRVIAAAVALGPGSLPQPVRTAVDAIAPQGEVTFRGREWSARGTGFRIEKHYLIEGNHHVRTVLVAADGQVLERAHSVPLGEVPEPVLLAAMEVGNDVRLVLIVSGPEREEFWQCEVGNRIGRTYVVRIGLDGKLLEVRRRIDARVDV